MAIERINDFDATVYVQTDASIIVAETIRVTSEGRDIRRGIFRDFPTHYQDRARNRYVAGFDVLDVQRDGRPEAWHTEIISNGVRVYMGSADHMLDAGEHSYVLRYRTTRQVGFFEGFDELYWNVTGNGWRFPIEQASATIKLPAEVDWRQLRMAFYTGPQASQGQEAEYEVLSGRAVAFRTTRALKPSEGLTVALGWPKGLVQEPGSGQRIGWFLADNGAALVQAIGLLAPLLWYLWAWRRVGRDPRKGLIIPRFEPPAGLTPAGCRYVIDMGLRSDAFTAAVISLGVKGYLKIDEEEDRFLLFRKKTPVNSGASRGEQALLAELLPEDESWVELDNEHYRVFQHARAALAAELKDEFRDRLFKLNRIYLIPALMMSALAAVVATPLPGGPLPWIVFAVLSIVMHVVFLFLMRAPTQAGRQVLDEIEGFRMYLDTAEQDRLDRLQSPKLTPELFETFLPYAFALGVQNHWCERFAREFPLEAEQGKAFTHAWYSGHRNGLSSLDHLGRSFGKNLGSAIASASTPPGSSSGSGGGGSSGGGGGGGGGGGW